MSYTVTLLFWLVWRASEPLVSASLCSLTVGYRHLLPWPTCPKMWLLPIQTQVLMLESYLLSRLPSRAIWSVNALCFFIPSNFCWFIFWAFLLLLLNSYLKYFCFLHNDVKVMIHFMWFSIFFTYFTGVSEFLWIDSFVSSRCLLAHVSYEFSNLTLFFLSTYFLFYFTS